MNPHNLATAIYISMGILLFLVGMVTPIDEEAYEEYKKIKKGVSPRLQKFRLMSAGIIGILFGIIFYFTIP